MGDDSLDYAEGLQVSGEFKRRIRHWTDMRDGIKEQGAPMSCIFNPPEVSVFTITNDTFKKAVT